MRNQAPNLRNLATVPASVLQALPAVPREGVELFLVTAEGMYDGRRYAAGELIVCRGEARNGDTTVLVPKGHGRPRLGRIDGSRLRGDADELCSSTRWGAAGRVVARYRRESDGWIIELHDGGRSMRTLDANLPRDAETTREARNEVGGPRSSVSVAGEEGRKVSSVAPPPQRKRASERRVTLDRNATVERSASVECSQTDPVGPVQLGLFVGQRTG